MKSKRKTTFQKYIFNLKIGFMVFVLLISISIYYFNDHNRQKESSDHHNEELALDKTPEAQREIRDKLVTMLEKNNPDSIFKVIDAIQMDQKLLVNCHEIAHDIGHHAYELFGFLDAMAFNNPNHVKHALPQYICAGGYMHGILEQLALHDPDFTKHPESVCNLIREEDQASCFHGVGHVMMYANNKNAPLAILGCRVIKDVTSKYRCFEGVRMEQFWGTSDPSINQTDLGWNPQDPMDTCIKAKLDEKPTCFLYSSFGYLKINPKDYSGAAHLCVSELLSKDDTHFCLKGLGMTMMSKFKGQKMEGSEIYVDGLTIDQKHAFYQGLINYAMLSGIAVKDLENSCHLLKNDEVICLDALVYRQ